MRTISTSHHLKIDFMPPVNLNLKFLESFKIDFWYKLLIYISAIMLIVSELFISESGISVFFNFAKWSLLIGLMGWFIEVLMLFFGTLARKRNDENIADYITVLLGVVLWLLFPIWIIFVLLPFNPF